MSDEVVSGKAPANPVSGQVPAVFSSKERAALVARALSDAARRARYSTKRRRSTGGLRARRGAHLLRLITIWSFVGIVALPALAFAGYLFLVASPQYVAEARFTVRGGLPVGMDGIGGGVSVPTMLIVQDTQVILQFMKSRVMVESLDREVGYEKLFQSDSIDWLSRLKRNQPIEKVAAYWQKHMGLSVQLPSGICTFTVRAFSPDDAVKVANAALAASERIVNDMNAKMRDDTMALAQAENKRAQGNLATARAGLERARNSEGMLDAKEQSTAVNKLIDDVQAQLSKMQQDYDSQRRYVRADAPQLRNLQTKMDAAQKQIDQLKGQLTRAPVEKVSTRGDGQSADRGPISGSMSRLDYAQLEDTIAEKIYGTSLAAVEQAHLASETKNMYINTFVEPVAAQQPEYPKRAIDIILFLAATLGIWGALVLCLNLARGLLA